LTKLSRYTFSISSDRSLTTAVIYYATIDFLVLSSNCCLRLWI
jgi:hypothetical protein